MPLQYLINLIAFKVYKEKILSHKDIRKMKYGMTVISYELIKIVLLFLIFSILGYLDLFIFSFCILMLIRSFSGGLHFESSLICFFVSLTFFSMTVIILPHILIPSFTLSLIIGAISIVIIFLYSPQPSPLRPIINPKRRKNLKYLSAFFSLICLVILLIFIHKPIFLACGIYTILLQALQLFLGKEGQV